MSDNRFWKVVVVINGVVPLAMLAWDASQGELGANPVNSALHTTGLLSLLFLLFTLTVTPLRRLTGWNSLIGIRRSLGLLSFFYACIHVAIYVSLDRELSVTSTIEELLTRQYLQVGLAALLTMTPLALTSTSAMVARLGASRWKMLHRLAYLAAGLGALPLLHARQVGCAATLGFCRRARYPPGRAIRVALLRSPKSGKTVASGNAPTVEP